MSGIKFGPNGIEFQSNYSNFDIDNATTDTTTGITINSSDKKRFKMTITNTVSSFNTTFTKKIVNEKIDLGDIIVYTVLTNHNNLDVKIYNINDGYCYIDFIPTGNVSTSPEQVEIMFLILT